MLEMGTRTVPLLINSFGCSPGRKSAPSGALIEVDCRQPSGSCTIHGRKEEQAPVRTDSSRPLLPHKCLENGVLFFAWPRSASTEVHRVANPSLSASDWISSSVLKSTRQIRKSGSDGRIIDIAHYHRRALGYQPAHPAQCSRCQPFSRLAASYCGNQAFRDYGQLYLIVRPPLC
jgi:hypothetical protein